MIKKDGSQSKKMGRPTVEITRQQFEGLCNLQCTLVEIAGFFHCSEDTIQNWCKKEYRDTFSAIYKVYSQNGKISLRRIQFRLAEKSSAMAIFLGKQYLGQKEKIETLPDDELKVIVENMKSVADLINKPSKNRDIGDFE